MTRTPASVEEEEDGSGGDSNSDTNGGDGTPASGSPIIGTPGNLTQGDDAADPNDPNAVIPAAATCGVGTFAFAPLTLGRPELGQGCRRDVALEEQDNRVEFDLI